jgi:hypothetical protein
MDGAESFGDVPSAQISGEPDIGHDGIDLLAFLQERDGAFSGACFEDVPAGILQLVGDLLAYQPLVLDDKNNRR